MKHISTVLAGIAIILCASVVRGNEVPVRQVGWKDLVPEVKSFENPMEGLPTMSQIDLRTVIVMREDPSRLEKMSPSQRELLEAAEIRLKQANIDVEGILKRHKEVTEQRRLDGEKVVAELDGQRLRMAGYLLPLETSDRKVTEFLLVPWVGACIHTPPPPSNQIVYVRYPEGIEASQVFAPVWIQGTMQTVTSTANLYLRDGSADIPTGYSLRASLVEPYE
jgi:hypothetical protein